MSRIVVILSIVLTLILSGCRAITPDTSKPVTVETTASIATAKTQADENMNMNMNNESIPENVQDLYNRFVASKDKYGDVDLQKDIEVVNGIYIWPLHIVNEDSKNNQATLDFQLDKNGNISEFTIHFNRDARNDCLMPITAWTIMSLDPSCDKDTANELATRIVEGGEVVRINEYAFFTGNIIAEGAGYLGSYLKVRNMNLFSDIKIKEIMYPYHQIENFVGYVSAYREIMDELVGEGNYLSIGEGNYEIAGDFSSGQIDADVRTDYGDVVVHLICVDRNWIVVSVKGVEDGLYYYSTQQEMPIYDIKTKEEKSSTAK